MRPIILLLLSCILLITAHCVRLIRSLNRSLVDGAEVAVGPSHSEPEKTPFVAIVSCIKSGAYPSPYLLEEILLPSIYLTITEKERASYRVELILGYDHDDPYWANHDHQIIPHKSGTPLYEDREPIPINWVSIRKDPNGDRPNRIPFNELCQAAYDYGATYIVRINDDTEFISKGWITVATKSLQSLSPPLLGVVGPTCNQGNQDIMVHDFVHVPTHLSIFDTYYPEVLDNYYVDDWITHVYGSRRTKQPKDWEVVHHLKTFWTRYEPTFHQDKLLPSLIKKGSKLVDKAIRKKKELYWYGGGEKRERRRDELQVLGTETITSVDGPMQEVHLSLMRKQ
ncbi:hypothetical protein ACHAXR_008152 [Thalassiosira sp. AJA248-18]